MSNFKRNPEFAPYARRALKGAVTRAAGRASARSRELIEDSGSGEEYGNFPRQSSAPGEPPVSQTGELAESMDHGFLSETQRVIAARFGSNQLKARFLELGTLSMEPRPFLRPGLQEAKPAMLREFRGIL